jgi:hypothetical protein
MRNFFAVLTLSIATASHAAEPSRFQFVEVLEVSPQYSQVPCESCGSIPDLRFNGTKFRYRCNGDLYENWIPKTLQIHVRIQVIDCSKVVITKDRKPIMENSKGSTDSDGNLFYTDSHLKE